MTPDWSMSREIEEQPDLFERRLDDWVAQADELSDHVGNCDQIALLGRGSSRNACVYASYLYALQTGNHPIEFRLWTTTQDQVPDRDWSNVAVLAFSASGQSTDVARAARWLADRGAFVVGITNATDDDCALGEAAHELFYVRVGDERAVPATKSFNAQLFASAALVGFDIRDAVAETIKCFEKLSDDDTAGRLADLVGDGRAINWIARGPSLGAARDAALKCRECARISSTGWSSAEFQHGYIGSLDPDDRAIIFSDANQPAGTFSAITKELLSRQTPFAVTGLDYYREHDGIPAPALAIDLPSQRWARAPVFAYLSQKTALELAVRRDLNPDNPSGLQKVTETT